MESSIHVSLIFLKKHTKFMSNPKHEISQRSPKGFGYLVTIVIILVTLFAMLIGFASCNTERRAARIIHKAHRVNDIAVAKHCAEQYPSIASVRDSTIYIVGEPMYDTVQEFVYDTITQTKWRTIYKLRVDTIYKDKSVTKVDKAENKVLQHEVKQQAKEVVKSQTNRNWWMWVAIGEFALIVAWIVKKIWIK